MVNTARGEAWGEVEEVEEMEEVEEVEKELLEVEVEVGLKVEE